MVKGVKFTHGLGGPVGRPRDWMPIGTFDLFSRSFCGSTLYIRPPLLQLSELTGPRPVIYLYYTVNYLKKPEFAV